LNCTKKNTNRFYFVLIGEKSSAKVGDFFYIRIRPAHAWWGFCLASYYILGCSTPTKIFPTLGETVVGVDRLAKNIKKSFVYME